MKKTTKRGMELEIAELKGRVAALEQQCAAYHAAIPRRVTVPAPAQVPFIQQPTLVYPQWELMPKTTCGTIVLGTVTS